jgi:hypothetical protein
LPKNSSFEKRKTEKGDRKQKPENEKERERKLLQKKKRREEPKTKKEKGLILAFGGDAGSGLSCLVLSSLVFSCGIQVQTVCLVDVDGIELLATPDRTEMTHCQCSWRSSSACMCLLRGWSKDDGPRSFSYQSSVSCIYVCWLTGWFVVLPSVYSAHCQSEIAEKSLRVLSNENFVLPL